MPGTLNIGTISDGTNSTSATNVIQGSAKAWVNFNGTTSPGTIRASYNVSSVTKNGTGDYTVNFTNAFTDANYSVVCTSTDTMAVRSQVTAPTTTQQRVVTFQSSTQTFADYIWNNVAVFR